MRFTVVATGQFSLGRAFGFGRAASSLTQLSVVNSPIRPAGLPPAWPPASPAHTVNPLAQPAVSSINVSGGQVSLVATGTVGPDYTVLVSTNLASWQVLFTSNSPPTPVTLVDTNNPGAYSARFYRTQLGP
jgi:hypothetical protein